MGAVAIVIDLIDCRRQRRDWLHVLGVALVGIRPVSALLEYLVALWR